MASDIRAGRSFVELYVKKNRLVSGLKQTGQLLKNTGASMMRVGAIASAAGAAITAPFVAAVRVFTKTGDELDKMSQRTGVSSQALAELGFAAEQSGSNMGAVENSIRKMQKTIGDANRGLSTATDGLDKIGLSVDDLNGKKPEEQFQLIADGVAAIEDPTKRASAAMDIFGSRQGTALLPMLENMRALRQEARDLGLAPSDKDVANAAALTDAFNRIRRIAGAGLFSVGAALAEPLLEILKPVQDILVATGKWVRDNKRLFVTIAAVGVGVIAAGAAITGLGLSISLAGFALTGIASAIGLVGTMVAALLSPVGLITAALVGGAIVWAKYTESGQSAITGITRALGELVKTAKLSFGGIFDALRAGEWKLAGAIAVAGLQVGLLQGVVALSESVGGLFGDLIGTIGGKIANGNIKGAWETVVKGMAAIWDGFTEGIMAAFTQAARFVVGKWESAVNAISDTILEYGDTKIGKVVLAGTGFDPERSDALNKEQRELQKRILASAEENLVKAKASGGQFTDENGDLFEQGALEAEIGRLRESLGRPLTSALDSMKDDAAEFTGKTADSLRAKLNELDKAAQERTDSSKNELDKDIEGGANKAREALTAAQKNLERLVEESAKARAENDAKNAKDREEALGGIADPAGLGGKVIGSFSAAALQAQGQRSPIDKIADLAKQQLREAKEGNRLARGILKNVGMGAVIQ